jgi:hypothetical protein
MRHDDVAGRTRQLLPEIARERVDARAGGLHEIGGRGLERHGGGLLVGVIV